MFGAPVWHVSVRLVAAPPACGYNAGLEPGRVIKGSRTELETMQRKVRGFLRLTVEERLAVLQDYLSFVAAVSPGLLRYRGTESSASVRVIRRV